MKILVQTTKKCIHARQLLLKLKFLVWMAYMTQTLQVHWYLQQLVDFVQIVNTGNHWVCLSTTSCRPRTVKILPSTILASWSCITGIPFYFKSRRFESKSIQATLVCLHWHLQQICAMTLAQWLNAMTK